MIDAHQHFWGKELFAGQLPPELSKLVDDFRPQDLRPQLDRVGVQRTVLVQTHSSLQNTYDFLAIADWHPWVAGVVGWIDLTDPGIGRVLDVLQAYPKLKGFRHQWEDEADPAWILRDDVQRGLAELARRGIPYDLLAKPPNWEYIPLVAEALPDLPLVIDHIAKPQIRTGRCTAPGAKQFGDWAAAMAQAARFPQIMCKLSGMITEADWQCWTPADLKPYVGTAIELFGVDRVMYGSDWPVCLLAGSYGQVFDAMQECCAGLTETERAQVFGDNARRFYRLEEG